MIAKFEKSGTHIHKEYLKIRIDLYPEPTDKTYAIHHIEVPVIPKEGYQGKVDEEGSPVDQKDYDLWIKGLPKVWRTNPCLCHFITVPSTITQTELDTLVKSFLDKNSVTNIDDALSASNMNTVSSLMKRKVGTASKVSIGTVEKTLVDTVNTRLSAFEVKL